MRFIVSVAFVVFVVWFLMMLFKIPVIAIRTYTARANGLEEDFEKYIDENKESESVEQ